MLSGKTPLSSYGGVAQLVERLTGSQEVRGFESLRLHSKSQVRALLVWGWSRPAINLTGRGAGRSTFEPAQTGTPRGIQQSEQDSSLTKRRSKFAPPPVSASMIYQPESLLAILRS